MSNSCRFEKQNCETKLHCVYTLVYSQVMKAWDNVDMGLLSGEFGRTNPYDSGTCTSTEKK